MSEPIVETSYGKIQGQAKEDLVIFKWIAYAPLPVGTLRWPPSQPVEPWENRLGIRSSGWVLMWTIKQGDIRW